MPRIRIRVWIDFSMAVDVFQRSVVLCIVLSRYDLVPIDYGLDERSDRDSDCIMIPIEEIR